MNTPSLEERVAALEAAVIRLMADSHPPVDLRPSIRNIVRDEMDAIFDVPVNDE